MADALARGWHAHQAGDLDGAERTYREVVAREPGSAEAWCYLGMALHDRGRYDEAVAIYRRALDLRPDFPVALNNLGNSLRLLGRLAEAIAAYDAALRLRPDYVNAFRNKGMALAWDGRLAAAESCYERLLALAPADAAAHKDLAMIWLLHGRFERGWPEYEWRIRATPGAVPVLDRPRWDGAPLTGRSILLAAEQGLGDTIQFVRYAPFLARRVGCRVVVAVQRRLLPLVATCPGIETLVALDDTPPPTDVGAPLLSVPGLLRQHDVAEFPSEVPYLSADPTRARRWSERLAVHRGVRVGVAWQGNPTHPADRMRSVPLTAFSALAALEGVVLVSLQQGPGVDQLREHGPRLGIVSLGEGVDASGAFVDTAAVMRHLDLVVTCDTAIAHLAGALGVPVRVALPYVSDWRWLLGRDDSPWYPTMRLFRQATQGDWPDVFARIAAALRQP